MDLRKLDLYLYESKKKEISDIVKLPFDELIEKLSEVCCEERETIISTLPKEIKDKIIEIIDGGLL
jgi:hypothetical protein